MTIVRHPLAAAIVKRQRWGWYWWPVAGWQPTIDWQEHSRSDALPVGDYVDIFREPGLRVTVVEDEYHSDIVLQFQHTWCDGLGAADFASDLLTAYANCGRGDGEVPWKRLDPTALLRRGWEGLSRWQWAAWLARRSAQVRQFDRFYKRKPILIAAPKSSESEHLPADYPRSVFHRFSRSESAAIQRVAKQRGTTVNSLLLCHLCCVVRQWRLEQGAQLDEQLRLATPVSLRTSIHRTIPAANIVSMVCFDRQLGETLAEDALLQSIDRDLERIRTERLDLVFSFFLRLLQFWPTQLAKGLRRKRFSGTVLLTNLGPALANCLLPRRDGKLLVGEHTLENVEFLPVLRPGQGVTLGVSTYSGTISLGMHYDGRTISAANATTLLAALVQRLEGRKSTSRCNSRHDYGSTWRRLPLSTA